ncbi:MAG TPA: CPBP family intramembrane glutamic endopeptidase, partial [Polyangiaceae bacterium]|nr:CPBP family intramembrane glutamic endopeptidase [Polyangiaceae bacterium]
STGEAWALLGAAVVVAPIAEEYFFRGWLQRAIKQDLPLVWKHWAFVLGALAFALAHLGSYALPQLFVGLAAGALYARGMGLGPAIVAHAVNNGLILLWLWRCS